MSATPSASQQQFELFKVVLAMREDATTEWLQVLDLMRELVKITPKIMYGEPHWKSKFGSISGRMKNLLLEWDEQAATKAPSFSSGDTGEAA